MKIISKLWIIIVVLIILSPLGLLFPKHFKAGAAWGEWGVDKIQEMAGYIPKGFGKLYGLWHAPISGYKFRGWEGKGLPALSFAYIISAIIGTLVVVGVVFLIAKVLSKK